MLDRALAHAEAYRVLAATFRDPDSPDPGDGPAPAALRGAARQLSVSVAGNQWRALKGITRRDRRASEHRAVFGHVVAHGCPPYETEYGRDHVFAQAQQLGDISGFYAAFGVRTRVGGERPDHIACELEFMALLAIKEALALARGETERVEICRIATVGFMADHLARWLPAFAGRIARSAPGSGLDAAAAIAAAVVADHARELGIHPSPLGPDDVLPMTAEPDGFAFECGPDDPGSLLHPPD